MREKEAVERFISSLHAVNRFLRTSAFGRDAQPVTRVQWLILRCLQRNGACTIGRLAEFLDVRPSTMSQMIDRLEKAGYAVRFAAPGDARVKTVKLTERGEDLIRRMESFWAETLSEPFGRLTVEERAALVGLMEKLAANLQKRGE